MSEAISRRRLIASSIGFAAASSLGTESSADTGPRTREADADPWKGFRAGVASYTLRKLSREQAIKAIQRVGLKYLSIKDFHLSLTSTSEERRDAAAQFKAAGITPLSCGNITMQNDEKSIRQAFEYARDAGIPTIVCSPHPDSMSILDRMVKEFDIKIAIHNHGPEDKRFPAPGDAWKAAERYDKRLGLCIDVGHTARAGADPSDCILKYRERLYDLHFKDIASTAPDGGTLEAGRGVLDLESILKALLKVRYPHLLSFEYEKDGDDPLPGLAETVGYTRGLLAGIRR